MKILTRQTIALLLTSVALLMPSCSIGGAYFLDDGLRLAHDAQTGQYLGEVIGECKVREQGEGEEIKYYRIRGYDGRVIEVRASEVKLSKP